MRIYAEPFPILVKYSSEKQPDTHLIVEVMKELNGLLKDKNWEKLGEKTDRELNPKIKDLILSLEYNSETESIESLPDFVKSRLRLVNLADIEEDDTDDIIECGEGGDDNGEDDEREYEQEAE